MDLLVVRHAIEEDREAFAKSGKDDASPRVSFDVSGGEGLGPGH